MMHSHENKKGKDMTPMDDFETYPQYHADQEYSDEEMQVFMDNSAAKQTAMEKAHAYLLRRHDVMTKRYDSIMKRRAKAAAGGNQGGAEIEDC
jgi:hypothetical protein